MSGTDRTVMTAGPLLDIVDDEWRADTLPEDGVRRPPPPNLPRPLEPRSRLGRFPLGARDAALS